MNGYVTQQSGRWYAVMDDRPKGRRSFHRAASEDAATKLLSRLLGQAESGTYAAPSRTTLAEFAVEWLRAIRPELAPSTWSQYEHYLRLQVMPSLGNTRITDLTPLHVQRMLTTLHHDLAPKSVRHVHNILRTCLDRAVEWGILGVNPVRKVKAPPVPRREMHIWTPEQARLFNDIAATDPYYALYFVALTTGMRRGELIGLRWQDVDFDAERLTVQQTISRAQGRLHVRDTKTAAGRRRIALLPETITVLREHRQRQLAGGVSSPEGLVFVNPHGEPASVTTVGKHFHAIITAAGLPHIRLHDLRHSHASMLMALGVNPKVIAERLGHANISTTLGTYAHLLPDAQKEAVDKLGNLLATVRQCIPEK